MNDWITFTRNPRIAEFLDDIDHVLATEPEDVVYQDKARQIWENIMDDWGITPISRNGDDYEVFIAALNGESVLVQDICEICGHFLGHSSVGSIQSLLDYINLDHARRMGFAG